MATKPSEQQFAQLVKEQKSTIYTVCYMFSKDEDEVADLFEEVLVNLWKGFQEFQGRSNPRTWVYRVSLNTCISADRKKKRRKTIPLSMDINLFEECRLTTGTDAPQPYRTPRAFRPRHRTAMAREYEL